MGLERGSAGSGVTFLPPKDQEGDEEEPIQMAIIGRPNVGKSVCSTRSVANSAIVSLIRERPRHD